MKEEEIRKAAFDYAEDSCNVCENMDSFIDGANWALENQWISVKDELPRADENDESDIIFVRKGRNLPFTAYYDHYTRKWRCARLRIDNITHWMPIPKLKEESK